MKQLRLRSFALDSQLQEQLTLLMAPDARKSDVSEDESLTKQSARHVVGLARKLYTCRQSWAAYLMLKRITLLDSTVVIAFLDIFGAST